MSKQKKRHPQPPPSARTRSQGATLADDRKQSGKRLDPRGRNLLFLNLIFMSACQWMSAEGMISDMVAGIATVIGLVLLALALFFLFGKKRGEPGSAPRNNGWPM